MVGEAERAALLDLAGRAQKGAARDSAEPRLIRRTPAAARSSTANGAPARPMITLTGLPTAAHTVRVLASLSLSSEPFSCRADAIPSPQGR